MEVSVSGKAVPRFSRAEVAAYTERALDAIKRARAAKFKVGEVSIVFVDDAQMQSLNRSFRRKNNTTDVLTFPAEDDISPAGARQLGDIVISVDRAKEQARDQNHSVATEVRYLILHGLLHAFGYDHEADDGEMNALELKLRDKLELS